jgi:hypothetical protein
MNSELGLIRYDAMCKAIAECSRVDEAKAIRDKARALEVYAAQALNTEAESKAAKIRIRAERRAGQLLKEAKQAGQLRGKMDGKSKVSGEPTPKLEDLGITREQAADWQKLAAIPNAEFEAQLERPGRPSTQGIIGAVHPVKPTPFVINAQALRAWGWLREFERDFGFSLEEVYPLMKEGMQEDVARLAPLALAWLEAFLLQRKKRA